MLPIKYSFRLLSKDAAEKIKLDFKLKKFHTKYLVIKEVKENFEKQKDAGNDNQKRRFLKLAGIVGVGAVATLFFPKKAEALVFGSTPASNVVGIKDSGNNPIDPAIENGGNLEDINTNTGDTATNTGTISTTLTDIKTTLVAGGASPGTAGGYIRQDSNATIAKENGGNLADIKAAAATLNTTASTLATESAIIYLRRLVRQVDSLAVIDSAQRQKITVDAITGSLTLGTVTTVGSTTALGGVDARFLYIDTARNTYANGIRRNITIT